jgi:hypothetical protein
MNSFPGHQGFFLEFSQCIFKASSPFVEAIIAANYAILLQFCWPAADQRGDRPCLAVRALV